MHRLNRLVFVGIILGFVFSLVAVNSYAQTAPTTTTQTIVGPTTYPVQPGDTVAGLSPDGWQRIKAATPYLNDEARNFKLANGAPGLWIYPGRDVLTIPAGVTITFRHSTPVATTPATPIVITPTPSLTAGEVRDLIAGALQPLWWLLLLLLLLPLLLLVGLYLLYRALRDHQTGLADRLHLLISLDLTAMQTALMGYIHEEANTIRARLNQMFARMNYEFFHVRREVRQVHLEVIETRLDIAQLEQQPQFHVVDLDAMFAGEPHRQVDPDADVDFVEVTRANGERFSLNVIHGSSITPVATGVEQNGRVTLLTEDAARERRDELAIARQERQFDRLAGV